MFPSRQERNRGYERSLVRSVGRVVHRSRSTGPNVQSYVPWSTLPLSLRRHHRGTGLLGPHFGAFATCWHPDPGRNKPWLVLLWCPRPGSNPSLLAQVLWSTPVAGSNPLCLRQALTAMQFPAPSASVRPAGRGCTIQPDADRNPPNTTRPDTCRLPLLR